MAGYADLSRTVDYGANPASTIDDIIEAVEENVLDGVAVEHDDGQTTPAHQGYHVFATGGTLPNAADRPIGAMFFLTGSSDQLSGRVNNGASWDKIGIGSSQIIDGSVVVNSGTEATVNIQAWGAEHRNHSISAYTDAGTSPIVHIGYDDPGGSDVYAWVERNKASGQDELHIANRTASNETVFYRVFRLVL